MELLHNKCDTLDGILLVALYMELLYNDCDLLFWLSRLILTLS